MNGRLLLALCISASLPVGIQAQFLQEQPVPAYGGTGAFHPGHTDPFSFVLQPAALARVKSVAAGVSGGRGYGLKEFSQYSIVATLPAGLGTAGLQTAFGGFTGYSENVFSLGYGRMAGEKLSVGMNFCYQQLRIPGYGAAGAMGAEAGLLLQLTKEFYSGIRVKNPVAGRYGKDRQERMPSLYAAGFGYAPSAFFYVSTEFRKTAGQPVNIAVNFQYRPLAILLLRGGMETAASVYWAGAGFVLKKCRLDLFTTVHPQLGLTPGLQVLFHFKTKEHATE